MSYNLQDIYTNAKSYSEFLEAYGKDTERVKWEAKRSAIQFTQQQSVLVEGFSRKMYVLCMAGTWCGDCADQCPIFARLEALSANIEIRFVDRDDCDPAFRDAIRVCGGNRVPSVVFMNEDFQQTGMYGDRTLSKYRWMVQATTGESCSAGLTQLGEDGKPVMDALTGAVLQDWIDEFERNQWIMRTSPRLRQRHGD